MAIQDRAHPDRWPEDQEGEGEGEGEKAAKLSFKALTREQAAALALWSELEQLDKDVIGRCK